MVKMGFLLLSGGRSKRMGSHKALLEVDGSRLLDKVAKAGESFDECILSANDPAIPTPQGFMRCADVYPGCGPMAGIHAALSMTTCDALVTAPCDAPYYSAELAQYLAAQMTPELNALVLVNGEGRIQPLCGVYSKRCLPVLEAHLKENKLKLIPVLELLGCRFISLPGHLDEQVFLNLNTPQDVQRLREEKA